MNDLPKDRPLTFQEIVTLRALPLPDALIYLNTHADVYFARAELTLMVERLERKRTLAVRALSRCRGIPVHVLDRINNRVVDDNEQLS